MEKCLNITLQTSRFPIQFYMKHTYVLQKFTCTYLLVLETYLCWLYSQNTIKWQTENRFAKKKTKILKTLLQRMRLNTKRCRRSTPHAEILYW